MSMRLVVVICALLVCHCQKPLEAEDPYIAHCRTALEHAVAPPTPLVVHKERREKAGRREDVLIDYDAADAFGAPIRDIATCSYEAPMASERGVPTAVEMVTFTIGGRVYGASELQLMNRQVKEETPVQGRQVRSIPRSPRPSLSGCPCPTGAHP